MVMAIIPFVGMVPAPGSMVEGGMMENIDRAIIEIKQSPVIQGLIAFQVLACGL